MAVVVVAALLGAPGCRRYAARPLNPPETLARIQQERTTAEPEAAGPFTFVRAVELMRTHSPVLKEAQAEYETALALAKVKTPLPNPGLETGFEYAFGDAISTRRWAPLGSIGFAFPTGGRLKRQDELNRMRAEQAQAEATIRCRETYLDLRRLYAGLVLRRAVLDLRHGIAESAEKSIAATKKAVEAGFATGLDVGLMELEAARTKMEALKTEGEIADTEGAMAELIGLHAGTMAKLPEKPLPDLPAAAPTLDELRAKLLPANLTLARLRLAYDVAERELRLEIAKQYPDFRFGPSFANETGESKHVLGLTLGIELPAFDRNQQAIATADKRRDEVRVRYEAAANRVLARLERAWRALQLAQQKRELLRNVLEPKAKANIEFARKALESGVTDTLRFLETERGQRSVLVEAVEVELAVREAWVELEQTVGCALFRFPDEPEGAPGEASQPEEARRE